MDGLTLQQTWQFTPPFAKRIVDWLQEAIPIRLKNLHIVNQPYIFNVVFALFKPFLKEKLKKRIVFHGTDRKSLHKYISPDCLPKDYGGNLDIPPIDGKDWYEYLLLCDVEYKGKYYLMKMFLKIFFFNFWYLSKFIFFSDKFIWIQKVIFSRKAQFNCSQIYYKYNIPFLNIYSYQL